MKYTMTPEDRDMFIQIVSAENYALVRGSSEEYLLACRERYDFYMLLKRKYNIKTDIGINIMIDAGVIITME